MDAKSTVTRGSSGEIHISGSIDTSNAQRTEERIREEAAAGEGIVLEVSALNYISSAGLRVLLRLKKEFGSLTMTGVSPNLYGILEMTGFSEILDIRRADRLISVDGCEIIGEGAEGTVYRVDRETVVKVYRNTDPEDIRRRQDIARKVFIMGIPTAIPYDIVRTADGRTGAVYELLNAQSYASLLISGGKSPEEIAGMSMKVLETIHSIVPDPGLFPVKRDQFAESAACLQQFLSRAQMERLKELLYAMPENGHLIHGDFHIKNIMYQDGETILIDMDTLSTGDPVFEFAQLYLAYIAYSELDPGNALRFFGIPRETAAELYDRMLSLFFKERPEMKESSQSAVRLIAYCQQLINVRNADYDRGFREKLILHLRERIKALLGEVSSLAFSCD